MPRQTRSSRWDGGTRSWAVIPSTQNASAGLSANSRASTRRRTPAGCQCPARASSRATPGPARAADARAPPTERMRRQMPPASRTTFPTGRYGIHRLEVDGALPSRHPCGCTDELVETLPMLFVNRQPVPCLRFRQGLTAPFDASIALIGSACRSHRAQRAMRMNSRRAASLLLGARIEPGRRPSRTPVTCCV